LTNQNLDKGDNCPFLYHSGHDATDHDAIVL